MNDIIKIIIADDHQLVIDGIRLMLKSEKHLEIIAEAENGEKLLVLIEQLNPDLVITDLSMPGMSGIELIKKIKTNHSKLKVLVVSMHDEEEIINEILFAEAEGYILKNSGKKEIIDALKDLIDGKTHFGKGVADAILKRMKSERKNKLHADLLSPREIEVLQLILEEFTSKEIAEKLHISKQTVDTHRANLLAKTEAKTLVGLIKYALENGMRL